MILDAEYGVMRRWIVERHSTYLRRESGQGKPWTDDVALRSYRFCNVSRRFDKMTRRLAGELHRTEARDRRLLMVIAARLFNRSEAWDVLLPWIRGRNLSIKPVQLSFSRMAAAGQTVLSGVWINTGSRRHGVSGASSTWEANLAGLKWAVLNRYELLDECRTLESTWRALQLVPQVGAFIANEMTMDIAYFGGWLGRAADRDTFVRIGPGAVRGLRRLQGREPGGLAPKVDGDDEETFAELREALRRRPCRPAPDLTLHDVEHCLCEYDKYARVLAGGRLKNRYAGV